METSSRLGTSRHASARSLPDMALALLLLQTATPSRATSPEKFPAWLTLIFLIGVSLIVLLLLLSVVRSWLTRSGGAANILANLPGEIRKRLGSHATNRGLRGWRWLVVLVLIAVFGFYVYWARYDAEQNSQFQQLS